MKNFIPVYWSKYVEKGVRNELVLANWCDYKFDKKDFKKGDRVAVTGVNKATVKEYTGADIEIEDLGDNNQYIDITQADYFAFGIEDIDKAQADPEFFNAEFDEAKYALAEKADKFVGELAKEADANMISSSTDISAEINPLATIDAGRIKLYKNGVSQKEELAADLNPEHCVLLQSKLASLFSENVEYIKRAALGKYGNIYLRMSNNLYNDGTDDYEMIRTRRATAFVECVNKIEDCKREKRFGIVVKGLHNYGAKLMRRKEMYVIKVH